MQMLYEIGNLKQRYGSGPLTLDIEKLEIRGSGITGLVGPNGSGKSTLLKVLSFIIPYQSGSILYDGSPAEKREKEIRRDVTYLLQSPYLLNRSVYENIAYGLKLRGAANIGERVRESLAMVGLEPSKFADRPWYRLSGGEAQRVALASRIALRPRVLLLDEPTANVDEASAQLVMEAAVRASEEYGAAVIISTHDLSWLYEMSSDVITLYHGRVVNGGAENIFRGRWKKETNYMAREFSDGQKIFAPVPPNETSSAAVLAADAVHISAGSSSADSGNKNILLGRIVQMTLERSSGTALVSAAVSESIIKARIKPDEISRLELTPSKEVCLTFDYSALMWID